MFVCSAVFTARGSPDNSVSCASGLRGMNPPITIFAASGLPAGLTTCKTSVLASVLRVATASSLPFAEANSQRTRCG